MKQVRMNGKQLREYINEQTNIIMSNLLENKRRNKLSKMNESNGTGLYAEIRFVQGGDDDYEDIMRMFCGDDPVYCEGNSQAVIDYLKQWDSDENELTPNEPRIARHDSSYADENGDYVLLYNSSVGGCFLLYRPADEREIDWYENRRGIGESKKKTLGLTESDLHRIVKETVNRILNENGIDDAERKKNADKRNRMMQKYSRFNDGSNNPYSDEGRYYRHLETEPQ